MATQTRRYFFRDAIAGAALVAALALIAVSVPVQLLQIPGYLVIVGSSVVEPLSGFGVPVVVAEAVYYAGVGVLVAVVSAGVRRLAGGRPIPSWRLGTASVLALLGGVSLVMSISLLGSGQLEPILLTGVTAFVLLGLAGWLSGLLGFRTEFGFDAE